MEIEVGSIYKVNHSNCPNSSSLNSIKAVLVKKKSNEEVTVVFPSNNSIDKFFGVEKFSGSMQPSLDEKLVMGFNLCDKILAQKISFEEFAIQRGHKNFWVLGDHNNNNDDDDDVVDDQKSSSVELGVKWDTRRRTRVYTRRKNNQKIKDDNNKVITGNDNDEDDDHDDLHQAVCEEDGVNKEIEEKVEEVVEKTRCLRKRKCQFKEVSYTEKKMKMNKNKNKNKKRKTTIKDNASNRKFTNSQHRWTIDRYKLAEMNLFKIMKEKGASPDNPVLRPDVRAAARKLIGDTGLLDHLLKHMAGKLAPGGKERFCRRHNPEGAMEYWVESADFAQVQKTSPGVDSSCLLQLKELKEEVFNMKREIGKLSSKMEKENTPMLIADPTMPENAADKLDFETSIKPLKEVYAAVMKKRAYVENQLLEISKSFSEMQEEIERLRDSEAPALDASQNAEKQTTGMSPGLEQVEKSMPTAAEQEERLESGFRMCRPQGTFVWPSEAPSSTLSQAVVPLEDLLGYPTPSSVSSSFRAPSLMFPPSPQYYYCQPQQLGAPISKPVATKAGVTVCFSTASIGGSTTIQSIDNPATASSTSFHKFVPDLNQLPIS